MGGNAIFHPIFLHLVLYFLYFSVNFSPVQINIYKKNFVFQQIPPQRYTTNHQHILFSPFCKLLMFSSIYLFTRKLQVKLELVKKVQDSIKQREKTTTNTSPQRTSYLLFLPVYKNWIFCLN